MARFVSFLTFGVLLPFAIIMALVSMAGGFFLTTTLGKFVLAFLVLSWVFGGKKHSQAGA